MHLTSISYSRLQRRYGGRFIARQDDKVLASGATYRAVLAAIKQRHIRRADVIVGYVPPRHAVCIYGC